MREYTVIHLQRTDTRNVVTLHRERDMKRLDRLNVLVLIALFAVGGCSDSGTNTPTASNPPPTDPPVVSSLVPDSAAVGDIIHITGLNFGASKGSSSVAIGGQDVSVFAGWTNTEILAEIPLLATTDSIRVTVGGRTSAGRLFRARQVSYAQSVGPVFAANCVGCHGGSGSLFLTSRATLLAGTSNNGPVVVAGNGEGSKLITKLRGTAGFGSRMPQGGPFLSNAEINKISTWIQQGAKDN
jgi:hypothetical protein